MSHGQHHRIAFAEDERRQSASDLAKAAQNDTADLISLPFQNNSNFDGPTFVLPSGTDGTLIQGK